MFDKKTFTTLGVLLLAAGSLAQFVQAADAPATDKNAAASAPAVEFFQAIADHQVDVKFIAKSEHDATELRTDDTLEIVTFVGGG